MTRVSAEYPALNGGISQKNERSLRLNTLREQLNMVFDPVLGLTRRPGTQAVDDLTASLVGTASNYREHTIGSDNERLSVYYSTGAGGVVVANQTTNTLLPLPTVKGGDTLKDTILAAGAAAVTSVGDLFVMAGNGILPSYVETFPWAEPDNQSRHVIWVRGGAYSRAFKLTMVRGNTKCTVEYTTREASYPKLLDTSDLLPTDPEYSKKVNDRTNAYNSEATAWIAAALVDIAPENIAAKLAAGLEQSGFLSPTATVLVVGPNVTIYDPTVEEVESDDGGDGNLMRAVGNVVGAPELLTVVGYPSKIVKVRPGNSERGEVFYLKARAKDGSSGAYTAVTWEETAGEVSTPDAQLLYLVVDNDVAFMSTDLVWINTQTGREFPTWQPSIAGDLLSNPSPEFFGEQITAMAVFQDRLLICRKDGYVAASQPGDYFNFYRQSAVTVNATDPVTFFILGGDGDTTRHIISYDKNIILVGDLRQYILPGRTALVPGAGAGAFAAVTGMATIRPAVVQESLFFAKHNNGYGSMHAMRPGRVAESPYVAEVSGEVNTLIATAPVEVVALSTPDMVMLRGADGKLYVADYFHVEGEQRYALYHWDFPAAGSMVGISEFDGSLRVLFHRAGAFYLEKLEFQRYSRGAPPAEVSDAGRVFVSRVIPVSPRFSPESGNITTTGLGSKGFSPQSLTVATMIPFFTDTEAATISVTGHPAQTLYGR